MTKLINLGMLAALVAVCAYAYGYWYEGNAIAIERAVAPCYEAPSDCQTRLGSDYEVIYYPETGLAQGERY